MPRERNVKLESTSVTARGGIGRMASGRFSLTVDLKVSLAGVERAEAQALAGTAHEEICP